MIGDKLFMYTNDKIRRNELNILNQIIGGFTNILNENLVGIYLHGSLATGYYTEESDIDIIIITNSPLSFNTKRKIIDEILSIKNAPKKGIEMHVILKEHSKILIYPTPFDLHYSNSHKERYMNDKNYICGGRNWTDKDLGTHFTILKKRGICLCGEAIEMVFCDVPKSIYIDSIIYDLKDILSGINENPEYYILNSARTLSYLDDDKVVSKLEGGEWAKDKLPNEFKPLIQHAINLYTLKIKDYNFNHEELLAFANFVLDELKSYTNS